MKSLYDDVTDAQLIALEEEFNAELTYEYKIFLKLHNGLDVEPPMPCRPKYDSEIDVDFMIEVFYGIKGEADVDRYNLSAAQLDYDFYARVPENIICIAEASYRQRICLSLSGEDKGKVYLWAPVEDWVEDDVVPSYEELRLIFDSFDELLQSIALK